jgi:hypothetical protein
MPPEIDQFFAGILGKKCWAVIAGPGTGSVVDLYFGEKIRRVRPLTNSALSAEERLFEGEQSLVVYSAWRIESDSEIISTSQNVGASGIDLRQILSLIGEVVVRVEFVSSFYDLQVAFSNGLKLRVFCDLSTGNEEESNYVMFNKSSSIAITPAGRMVVESR